MIDIRLHEEKRIRVLPICDDTFPWKLRLIPDAPICLYQLGRKSLNEEYAPAVAVIGARECSPYGRLVAKELGEKCAEYGMHVISGLARGIDSIAQQAALEKGGLVTAVLGSGVDICYPPQSAGLYERLKEEGVILSEYRPRTEPRSYYFPPRNRLISGLADAVIVVEAKKKSGTLITVDMALEQGKDVFAVPGRLTDPLSFGCNRLIGQGAEAIFNLDLTLSEIRDTFEHRREKNGQRQNLQETSKIESEIENERKISLSASVKHGKKDVFPGRKQEADRGQGYSDGGLSKPENPYEKETPEWKIWSSITVMGNTEAELYEALDMTPKPSYQEFLNLLFEMERAGGILERNGRYLMAD